MIYLTSCNANFLLFCGGLENIINQNDIKIILNYLYSPIKLLYIWMVDKMSEWGITTLILKCNSLNGYSRKICLHELRKLLKSENELQL